MVATIIALVVATFFCLAFASTRLIGVGGVLLLLYLNPLAIISAVAVVVAVLGFIHFYQRSSRHALPKPDDQCD